MKKHIAFLFLVIGVPVIAQVQLEIDAIKPRTIYAEEAAETVIDRGEIVVDPDVGLYVGDGVNAGGIDLTPTNKVLRTGSTMTGDLTMDGSQIYFSGTNCAQYYESWDEEYARLIYVEDEEAVFNGAVKNSATYYGSEFIRFNSEYILNFTDHYIEGPAGTFSFAETNAFYVYNNLDMDGNTLTNAVLAHGVETDPVFTNWLATSYEGSTGGVTAAGASNIAQNVLYASLASADTNSAASKQYVLDNAGTGGGMTNGYTIVDGGNVGTNMTFSFGAGQVQKYTQTASITNTIYSVPDTNKLWELTALIYGNGLDWDWNTNSVTFLGGDEPDLTSNGWNTVYLLYNPLTTNTTVGLLE